MKLGTAKGERRQIQIGAVTLEVARREARQVLGRVEAGGDPRADVRSAKLEKARAQTSTLGAFIETVYQPEVLAHLADGNGTALRFKKVWKPLFGVPLADLAETDVARILAKRKAQGIEAGTLHRDFAVLRAALRYAVKKKIITAMPMTSDKPAQDGAQKARAVPLRRAWT